MTNKGNCSNCGNQNTTPPGALGTIFCFDCASVTELKTGKKVFSSYPHPNGPYNYSENELFLILSFGGIVVTSAGKPDHLNKIHKWLSGENDGFFDGGLNLNKDEIQQIGNKLLEGDDAAIEIAKKLNPDEESNLFNVLFQILLNQEDVTIEEAGALIKICRITDSNWTSFFQYVLDNTNFKIEDLGPVINNIQLQLVKFEKKGDKFIQTDFDGDASGEVQKSSVETQNKKQFPEKENKFKDTKNKFIKPIHIFSYFSIIFLTILYSYLRGRESLEVFSFTVLIGLSSGFFFSVFWISKIKQAIPWAVIICTLITNLGWISYDFSKKRGLYNYVFEELNTIILFKITSIIIFVTLMKSWILKSKTKNSNLIGKTLTWLLGCIFTLIIPLTLFKLMADSIDAIIFALLFYILVNLYITKKVIDN